MRYFLHAIFLLFLTSLHADFYVIPVSKCPVNMQTCEGVCTDTQNNPLHCGSCTNACGADELCNQGSCLAVCEQERSLCPSGCVDLQTDPNNCGVCNTQCEAGEMCQNGNCTAFLPQGYACTQGSECETGFCVDGVCCNSACSSGCDACIGEYTDSSNGTCAPVIYGLDPHAACTEPFTCNGSGLCTN